MGESSDQDASAAPAGGLGRRQFLVKAAVAGTAVWVAPSIIAIQPAAAADLNSRPPKHVDPRVVEPVAQKPPAAVADAQLPYTGDDNDDLIIAGQGNDHLMITTKHISAPSHSHEAHP